MTWLRAMARLLGAGGPPLEMLESTGFAALDLETTGLDPRRDTIVALAVVPFRAGVPADGYVTLVDPQRPIPPASTAIHGIEDRDVAGAPRLDDVAATVADAVGDDVIVGHALDFDLAILRREWRARGRRWSRHATLDTRRLAAALHPEWSDVGLDAVAARLGIAIDGRHTARGDAVAAGRILLALLPRIRGHGVRTVGEARWLQRQAPL